MVEEEKTEEKLIWYEELPYVISDGALERLHGESAIAMPAYKIHMRGEDRPVPYEGYY
jgi:hypothetical protein